MKFTEALTWVADNDAKWGYERLTGGGYRFWLETSDQRVELVGTHATDWGCLLMDAVERLADSSPTERGVPTQSGSRLATEVAAMLEEQRRKARGLRGRQA